MNNLKIEHLGAEQQPDYGAWTCQSWENWLHPLNGPSPDQVHIMAYKDEHFRVAIWESSKYVLTATEMIDRARNKAETEEASSLRGWILDTRYWQFTNRGMMSGGLLVRPPEDDEDDRWPNQFIVLIARGAVELAITTNTGGYAVKKETPG
jgi:hypothetical protein